MELLTDALNLIKKYGISLNSFGPYLSYVNEKVGICISLKDESFGVLTRNFSFDSLEDFEEFLKKYAYYKKQKSDSKISFDDYVNSNPKIIYSYESDTERTKEVEEKNIELLKNSASSLKKYVLNLYQYRLGKLKKKNMLFSDVSEKLNEYKRNLHSYYNQEYSDEIEETLDITSEYNKRYQDYVKKLDDIINVMFDKYDLEKINDDFELLIGIVKDFENDEDYYSNLFDLSFLQNKMLTLTDMNDYLLKELESSKERDNEELKENLEIIKNKRPFLDKKEKFILDNIKDVNTKYGNYKEETYFNMASYLNKDEYIKLEEFNSMDDEEIEDVKKFNKDLILLYSPLRPIMMQVFNCFQNKKQVGDLTEYLSLYNEIKEKVEMPINVIVVQKFFNNILFNTFHDFITSITDVCEKIYKARKKYDFELESDKTLWSYDANSDIIFASNELIKDPKNDVSIIKLSKGVRVYRSDIKIVYNRKDINNIIVAPNDDYVIDIRDNNLVNLRTEERVNDYVPIKELMNVNGSKINVVTNIKKGKTYKYKFIEINSK